MQSRDRIVRFMFSWRGAVTIALLLGILLMLLIVGSNSRPNIDKLPEESSEIDYTSQANIHEGLELLRSVGGASRYNALSKDLFVFAKETIEDYKQDTKVVGFILTSEINKQDETLSFRGEFGSSSDTIDVYVTLLPNSRLKVTITNTKTKTNIDDKLPSNSPTNQYIATLPIDEDTYKIYFSELDEMIFVSIYERNPSLGEVAMQRIKDGIGDSLNPDTVTITFPSPETEEFQQPDQSDFYNEQTGEVLLESS